MILRITRLAFEKKKKEPRGAKAALKAAGKPTPIAIRLGRIVDYYIRISTLLYEDIIRNKLT